MTSKVDLRKTFVQSASATSGLTSYGNTGRESPASRSSKRTVRLKARRTGNISTTQGAKS